MKIAKFEFSLFGINTYVVYDPATSECAIVDPGMLVKEEEDAMVNFIEKNNLKVTHIIDTHLHVDHAVGVDFAKRRFGAPLFAHKADAPLGVAMRQQAAMFGMRETVKDVEIDSYLQDGDVIHIGEGELKVLYVPGHSPGSVALYDSKDGFVITGDALFKSSIGRTDLPGGSMPTLLKSIREKLLTLPDSTVVYPGHGPATTIGDEKVYNPFLG